MNNSSKMPDSKVPLSSDSPSPVQSDGRTLAEIDLSAIVHNFQCLYERVPEPTSIWAVIKKDAYGHGMVHVARVLKDHKRLAGFAVGAFDEALVLRQAGFEQTILVFSPPSRDQLALAIQHDISLTLACESQARELNHLAAECGRQARVHLNLDTGMGRLGRLNDETLVLLRQLNDLPALHLEGVYSHLADAWDHPETTRLQASRFDGWLEEANASALPCHWGGSDVLGHPGLLSNATSIRCGIALYGYHPAIPELRPAMALRSRVLMRRSVPARTTISYGGTFRTDRPTELAIVGAGYGNGYPRLLSGGAHVLINGQCFPILGRITMDQVIVDVSATPSIAVGDAVTLMGSDGNETIHAADLASKTGTISYEILCIMGMLNPKRYMS